MMDITGSIDKIRGQRIRKKYPINVNYTEVDNCSL